MRKNMIHTVTLLLLTSLLTCAEGFASQKTFLDQTLSSNVSELIKKRTAEAGPTPKIILRGELIHAPDMLVRFYKKRDFQPAWIGNEGPLPRAQKLIRVIEEAELEGLNPDYYHLKKVITIIEELDNNKNKKILFEDEDLVAFDLLLTDAFLMLGCHYSSGCVNPVTIEAEWFITRGSLDVASVLDSTFKKDNIEEALKKLLPSGDSYYRLRQALAKYRKIVEKGGWQTVTNGPNLKKGVKSMRVVELRKRLVISGDLDIKEFKKEELFGGALEKAVLKFQKRHGLEADGVVGPLTIKALNVPAEERTRKIELNMERMLELQESRTALYHC
jgi:murein L,D-transpeptidase YcbB/YkuD